MISVPGPRSKSFQAINQVSSPKNEGRMNFYRFLAEKSQFLAIFDFLLAEIKKKRIL